MKNTFREFVRSVLLEITRYERERGEKFDPKSAIKKLVSGDHPHPVRFHHD